MKGIDKFKTIQNEGRSDALDNIKSTTPRMQFCFLALYAGLVYFTILTIIPDQYGLTYNGFFIPKDFSYFRLAGILFAVIIILYSVNLLKKNSLTATVLFLLNLIFFIPGVFYSVICVENSGFFYCIVVYWTVMCLAETVRFRFKSGVSIKLSHNWGEETPFMILSIITIALSLLIAFKYGNGIKVFFVEDIYTIRIAMRESTMSWRLVAFYKALSMIVPVMVTYSILKKKWGLVILLSISQISMYTIACNKNMIYALIVAFLFAIFNVKKEHFPKLFLLFMVVIVCEGFILEEGFFSNIFRRVFELPNVGGYLYYDYFITNRNPLYYLSYSWQSLSDLLRLPNNYNNVSVGLTVGRHYFANTTNFNTGLVGAGLAKYGIVSLIISPIATVIGLKIFDFFLPKNINSKIKFTVFAILIVELISAPEFTLMLFRPISNLFLFLVFCIFIPTEDTKAL